MSGNSINNMKFYQFLIIYTNKFLNSSNFIKVNNFPAFWYNYLKKVIPFLPKRMNTYSPNTEIDCLFFCS